MRQKHFAGTRTYQIFPKFWTFVRFLEETKTKKLNTSILKIHPKKENELWRKRDKKYKQVKKEKKKKSQERIEEEKEK